MACSNGVEAQDPRSKAKLLRQTHFPPPPEADLQDIEDFQYPTPVDQAPRLTLEEINRAIMTTAKDKAPGPDGIPNRVLQIVAGVAPVLLLRLFQACLEIGIHPDHCKRATTIILRKTGKSDYTNPAAYRPIALLNTLGKALEAVISNRIRFLAETHALLPETQMGARRQRSTETALQLITEKIHTIWGGNKRRVASLLSVGIAGAFDGVSHARLIHNLRKRRLPALLIGWITDFLQGRTTEIRLGDFTLPESRVHAGIPQGSPISPILYLFYNADLLDICNNIQLRTSPTGFVDDVGILVYGESTEGNCRNLERLHTACATWAERHGSRFATEKYELIHFSRTPKRFNMEAQINLGATQVNPSTAVRILGVILDPKLKWQPHMRSVEAKLVHQLNALKTSNVTGALLLIATNQSSLNTVQAVTGGVPEYLALATRTWNLVTSRAGGRGCVAPEDLLFRALPVPIV
jgi:hypothetical protein